MNSCLEDRLAIADLMAGWAHRDRGEWEKLQSLFHPDGEIEVTWFQGKATSFIEGSQRMGRSEIKTKHLISSPDINFNGNKAVVETNCMIVGYHSGLKLGATVHARFHDMVEKRTDGWKIVRRQCIYDFSSFDFPYGIVDIEPEVANRFPAEYAALAYLLEKSGFPVNRVFATKGSELETTMKCASSAWLKG